MISHASLILTLIAQTQGVDSARSRAASALRCIPSAQHYCATVPDKLAPVEDVYFDWDVLQAQPTRDGGVHAIVRRRDDAVVVGSVVFEYWIGPDGKVIRRACHGGIPVVGQALASARAPDSIQRNGKGLLYKDACSTGPDGVMKDRYLVRVDPNGTVADVKLAPSPMSDYSTNKPYSRRTLWPLSPTEIRVPRPLAKVVQHVRGNAWAVHKGEIRSVTAGLEVHELILGKRAYLTIEISGEQVVLESRGHRLRVIFAEDKSLAEAWPRVARYARKQDDGAAPRLTVNGFLTRKNRYTLRGDRVERLCEVGLIPRVDEPDVFVSSLAAPVWTDAQGRILVGESGAMAEAYDCISLNESSP